MFWGDLKYTGSVTANRPTLSRLLWFLAALAFFAVGLNRGLTVDEYTTWQNTRLPISELIRNRLHAGHSPVYFVCESAWVRIVGDEEWRMRLPSVLFAAGTLAVLHAFLFRAFGPVAANTGSLLFLTHQMALTCAQSARPYAGALFFSVVVALFMLRWWEHQRHRDLAGIALATFSGLSFYPAFGLAIAAFATACAVVKRSDKRKAFYALGALIIPLLLLAVPGALLAKTQHRFELRGLLWPGERPINLLARVVFGDYKLMLPGTMRYVIILGWPGLLYAFLRRQRAALTQTVDFPIDVFVGAWVVVPVLLLAIFEAVTARNVLSHPRYLLPALGGIIITNAVALTAMSQENRVLGNTCRRRGRYALPIVIGFQLLVSFGWLRSNGDGPHELAPILLGTGRASAVIGMTHPLEYEWRECTHPRLIPLYESPPAAIKSLIRQQTTLGPVWLFVYDNNENALDRFVMDTLSPSYGMSAKLQCRDARAYYITARNLE